jgi:hypothetical protein
MRTTVCFNAHDRLFQYSLTVYFSIHMTRVSRHMTVYFSIHAPALHYMLQYTHTHAHTHDPVFQYTWLYILWLPCRGTVLVPL